MVALLLFCLSGCNTFKPSSTVPGQKDFLKGMSPSSFAEAVDVQERFERLRTELGVNASEAESRIRQQESVVDTCRWLGFLLIPGGIIISIWVDRRLGIGLALAGAGAIVLGMFIGGFWFKVASAVVAIGGGLIGGAMAVQKLIIRFQTNKQAELKRLDADVALANGDVAHAALQIESAKLLDNVATPDYKPAVTAPSREAVKLIESGTDK